MAALKPAVPYIVIWILSRTFQVWPCYFVYTNNRQKNPEHIKTQDQTPKPCKQLDLSAPMTKYDLYLCQQQKTLMNKIIQHINHTYITLLNNHQIKPSFNGIRTSQDLDISVLNICDISVLNNKNNMIEFFYIHIFMCFIFNHL